MAAMRKSSSYTTLLRAPARVFPLSKLHRLCAGKKRFAMLRIYEPALRLYQATKYTLYEWFLSRQMRTVLSALVPASIAESMKDEVLLEACPGNG